MVEIQRTLEEQIKYMREQGFKGDSISLHTLLAWFGETVIRDRNDDGIRRQERKRLWVELLMESQRQHLISGESVEFVSMKDVAEVLNR